MRAGTHLLVALLAVALAGFLFRWAWTPALFAAALLGGIFPDVDHEKTKLFRFFLIALMATVFTMAFASRGDFLLSGMAALASAGALFLVKPRHRGITHAWPAPIVFSLLLFVITSQVPVASAGGLAYASHLAADQLS